MVAFASPASLAKKELREKQKCLQRSVYCLIIFVGDRTLPVKKNLAVDLLRRGQGMSLTVVNLLSAQSHAPRASMTENLEEGEMWRNNWSRNIRVESVGQIKTVRVAVGFLGCGWV